MGKNWKFLFILGHPRSGTTLLSKILSSHSQIFFHNYEFNDLPFFYNNEKLYNKYGPNKWNVLAKDLLQHPLINLNETPEVSAVDFRNFIEKLLVQKLENDTTNYLGTKIVNDIPANIKMIKEIFHDAICIHIYRDPRDVYLSMKKCPWGVSSAYCSGGHWVKTLNSISSLKELPHYHEIAYEELITRPEETLLNLCNLLEFPFEQNMLKFYKNFNKNLPNHAENINQNFIRDNYNLWKNELTTKEINLLQCTTGSKAKRLGYDQLEDCNRINFWEIFLEYGKQKITRFLQNEETSRFSRKYRFKTKCKRLLKLKTQN